jgi:carboxymethylenebutenolidase
MEICALRDAAPEFAKAGAKVYGISMDAVAAQAAFARDNGVGFPLLSDADGKVAKTYGTLAEGRGYAKRVTFIVDARGLVRHVFSRVDVRGHGDEVLAVLKKLGAAPGGDTGHTGVLDEEAFKALHELKQGEEPELHGKSVDLGASRAYLALPEGEGPFPGIVVIHEWWGLNAHVKHWADRLAADGYAALAVDLYGGNVATTRDDALKFMRSVDEAAGDAVITSALRYLASDPAIRAKKRATIGWCFGGAWSLRAALSHPDLDAAVIYYGRLKTDPAVLGAIKAPILGVFGNEDGSIPPATVDAFEAGLKAAGVRNEILRYDANHAFANPSSARYDAGAAAEAWKQVRKFLALHLK